MAYEEEDIDPGVDGGYGDGSGTVSPLQMLMTGYSTVTPEGKAQATKVFQELYGKRGAYDEGEQSAYDEYEAQARTARETLRKAREVLAAKKTPTTKWLEMARGFGAPTQAGSFAESVSNYAGQRIPGRQRESEWETARDKQLLDFDQGMSEIDQQLAMSRLKMRQMRRAADDKLMLESMKIMGKPVPGTGRAPPKTAERVAQEALDKAYVKDYVEFISGGAADATKNIEELRSAHRALTQSDMKTGPIIGLVPKVLRDVFLPKASATQEAVESTVQRSLRQILGPQFTAKEGESLLARVYNPRLPEQINAVRVSRLIEQLDRAYQEKIKAAEYFEQHGSLKGYAGKKTWSLGEFLPDGEDMEGDDDPRAIAGELEEAISRGGPGSPHQAPQGAAPDEGMDEIDIESLIPAGGGYAKGGKVRTAASFAKAWQKALDIGDIQEARRIAKAADDALGANTSRVFTDSPVDRALNNISDSLSQPKPVQKHAEGGKVKAAKKIVAGVKQTLEPAAPVVDPVRNDLLKKIQGIQLMTPYIKHMEGLDYTPQIVSVFQKYLGPPDPNTYMEDRLGAMSTDDLNKIYQEMRMVISPTNQLEKGPTDPKKMMAEGGVVQGDFPDGRPRFRMPDGKVIRGRPGDTYELALDLYTKATGTAPTRPGLPPQQIPPREEMENPAQPPARPPMMAAQAEEPPSFSEVALGELPSSLAYTAAGAAGAGIGDKVLTSVGDRLIPGRRETPAQRRVLDMLQEQRRAPADVVAGVRNQQRMGVPAMAMDDPALRGTVDVVLPETGLQNASIILQRLKDRAGGLEERVTERVNQGLKPDDYFEQLDKMRNDLYSNSRPLYEAAYAANPAVKSKVLPKLLETPDGKKAVKTALRIMRNEGKKIGKQDAMNMVTAPSLEFLDRVKQGLDQLITKEEGHGMDYKATPLGKSMRGLRDALVNELDTATTPAKGESLYKKARAQYAGDLEMLDALQAGRDDFGKLQPQQLDKLLAGMSFSEKDAFRTGVAQNLFEALGTPTTDVNSARRIIGSTSMQAKLRTMFDTDKQFELFKTALEREAELHDLDKKSIRRAEAGQELHAEPKDTKFQRGAKYVPRLGWKSPMMWALQFIRNNQKATEKKMDEVLEHLKASTPEELADLEKTLGPKYGRRVSRKGRAAKTAVAGALAGAAYKIATGAEADEEDENYAE